MTPKEIYRPTVLVVEDDSAALRRITRMFHRETVLGVLQADTLAKALEYVNDPYCRFDGIVCDLTFAAIAQDIASGLRDGLDFLKIAQSIRPNSPSYVLSVDADDPIAARRAEDLGIKVAGWFCKLV